MSCQHNVPGLRNSATKEGTYSGVGVNRTAVDVEIFLGQHLGTLVDRPAGTIKDTAQHVL